MRLFTRFIKAIFALMVSEMLLVAVFMAGIWLAYGTFDIADKTGILDVGILTVICVISLVMAVICFLAMIGKISKKTFKKPFSIGAAFAISYAVNLLTFAFCFRLAPVASGGKLASDFLPWGICTLIFAFAVSSISYLMLRWKLPIMKGLYVKYGINPDEEKRAEKSMREYEKARRVYRKEERIQKSKKTHHTMTATEFGILLETIKYGILLILLFVLWFWLVFKIF